MAKADSVHSTPPTNAPADNPASPVEIFKAIGRLRREAQEEIARLIGFLDETENHMCVDDEDGADDEPSEDEEPSLGSQDLPMNQLRIYSGVADRYLIDCEADDSDDEPWLGFPEPELVGNPDDLCQPYANGTSDDRELQCEDEGCS